MSRRSYNLRLELKQWPMVVIDILGGGCPPKPWFTVGNRLILMKGTPVTEPRPTPKDKDAEARGYITDRPTPGAVVLKGQLRFFVFFPQGFVFSVSKYWHNHVGLHIAIENVTFRCHFRPMLLGRAMVHSKPTVGN